MTAAEEIADFAALMRELKQRSGLSYEALAKRAHMSTTTLHRYCKGEGVPGDNAAVARFARVCRATPEELVELHRRWVLADAARERARRAAATADVNADTDTDTEAERQAERKAETDAERNPADRPEAPPLIPDPAPEPAPTSTPTSTPTPARRRLPELVRATRRRWAWTLIAAGTAAAVAVTTALTLDLKGTGTGTGTGAGAEHGRSAEAATSSGRQSAATSTTHPSARPSPSQEPLASPRNGDANGDAVPLTVSTRTYAWEDPQCEGKYLIDRPPGQVSPPVMGQDVPGWVRAHGAVAADGQRVALTVQGTGDETVVIESLHVRVVDSSAPPAWNAYEGSSGCGGGVETRSFATDLDAGHPTIVPRAGQRGVPYKVSRSDPEVLYVTARVRAHDVKWYVELQWSSGGRQGTVRIDDHGKPFRTSGSRGRPLYQYLLGDTQWRRLTEENTA
ncbi:helix-turn-helix domain-containing protein [Streptomyces sp. NPDC054884]